jgi:diguanylate cyclase (GGDEF)-like protein
VPVSAAEAAPGAPPAIAAIAGALADDPQAVLHQALETLARDVRTVAPRQRLDAALRLAAAGDILDQFAHTRRGLEVGLPLAAQLEDDDAHCLLRLEAAMLAGSDGSEAAAVAPLQTAIAQAESAGKGWCVAATRHGLGRVYSHIGRNAESTAELLHAHRLYQQQGDKAGIIGVLSDLTWLYRGQQDNPQALRQAVQSGQAALALLDPARQRYLAATVNHSLAGAYESAGDFAHARTHVLSAMRFATDMGDFTGIGYTARLAGRIEMKAGQPARALALAEQARQVFAAVGARPMVLQSGVLRAQALLALGRRVEARQELDATEALRKQLDTASYDAEFYTTQLSVYESLGDFESALRAAKALAAAERRRVAEDNRKTATELQERFEAKRREAENALLREQQRAAESRHAFVVVTLLISLACAGVMVAYMVQLRLQRRRLAELAGLDDLTGLPNRRSIMEFARRTCKAITATHEPLCVAVMDIDHFKRVNDTHGHEVGDRALQTFARVCKRRLRGRDRVGRLGGEEFLLVLPGARREDLPAVFARLQAGLQAAQIPGMPANARLTFSMGCATLLPNEDIEPAIRRADEGVYRAKALGRDRLVMAEAVG